MAARWNLEGGPAVFLDRLLHEGLEDRNAESTTESALAQRARLVIAHVAARDDIGGEADEPHVLGIVGGTGLARNRHRQMDARARAALDHTFHHRGQVIGGDRIHDPFAVRLDVG